MGIETLTLAAASTTVSGSGVYFFNSLNTINAVATSTLSVSDYSMDLSGVSVSAAITTLTSTNAGGTSIIDTNDTAGRTLNGTSAVDTLNGKAGADTFYGGGGNDNLYLGSSDIAADTVKYTATSDFGTAGDTIYQFEQGVGGDVIDFASSLLFNGSGSTTLNELTATSAALTIDDLFIELGGANFNSTTTGTEPGALAVITALDTSNLASGDKVLFAMDDGTDTYLWRFAEDGTTTNNATSGEIQLVATISGLADAGGLADGDFTITV